MRQTVARSVREALERLGVRYVFGIPGVHTVELWDEIASSPSIEAVLVTHELSAGFMADAISRSTDSIGTLLVVPAAGLAHAASGIGEAYLDGVPMLVLSGGVRTDSPFGYQLHDVDQARLVAAITKRTWRLSDHASVAETLNEAWLTATGGEPGPVYVEVPANLQLLSGETPEPPGRPEHPLPAPPDAQSIERAAALLAGAEHPGLYVGWGARHAGSEVARIAERLAAPVATTLQGLSAFPGDHPLHAGFGFGPSAVPAAENAFEHCDAMLAVGVRFAEIATGSYGKPPPKALVHVDVNREVFGRNYPAEVAIEGDAQTVLAALADALEVRVPAPRANGESARQIAAAKKAYLEEWLAHDSGERVNPGRFLRALRERLPDDAVVVADDGNHTFLAAELLPVHRGGLFLSPTDFNAMGYCVPATIAIKLAQPTRRVVGIVGDGAFLMTGMETLTAAARSLGCVWFVFDDGELAQIAQAQAGPYARKTATVLPRLDHRAFAEAAGLAFVSIGHDGEIESGIDRALARAGERLPVLVSVAIDYSKPTRFTKGTMTTNVKRLDLRNKARIFARAAWRRLGRTR
jgi:acetolactate synthase-1/2/3 large subunit